MRPLHITFRRLSCRSMFLWVLAFSCGFAAVAQQPGNDSVVVDKHAMDLLLKRIDQLEDRVRELEADKTHMVAANAPPSPPPAAPASNFVPATSAVSSSAQVSSPSPSATAAPQETEPSQSENVMAERMDLSKTLLRIRGFGDVNLHGDTQKGSNTAFSLGQLDLFVTSDVSDKFKFLSEIVFEAGPDNIYGVTRGPENLFSVDVERYLMQYSFNDYLNISAGRGHTAIGFYNTAYHHSTWLQTTEDRPFLFAFEDRGGILPIHIVGASASGLIPSGPLGLHYVAEIGNGRESRDPLNEEPVQNEIDDANHKAFNLALFARPEAIRGLQTGFSVYRDVLAPASAPRIGETIFAAHAVLIRSGYEWLNEALLIRHAPFQNAKVFHTPGFYTQVSRQFGSFRPYFRYQYVNVAKDEPVFPDVALRHGPSLGIRYDASEFVALKFQYDYLFLRNQPGVNGLTLQLGFTF